jgi:hypothetical protein
VGGLEIDRVEAADDAVVGEGHLGCDVGGGVGCLRGVRGWMGMLGGHYGGRIGRTSWEKARVDIRA